MDDETYIEALRHELAGVVRSGDKVAQKAVKAELDRASGTKPETAVVPTENVETRKA